MAHVLCIHWRATRANTEKSHFAKICASDCTKSRHFHTFRCSHWRQFRQNDISVSTVNDSQNGACMHTYRAQFMYAYPLKRNFLSLILPEAVISRTSGAASDQNFVDMMSERSSRGSDCSYTIYTYPRLVARSPLTDGHACLKVMCFCWLPKRVRETGLPV